MSATAEKTRFARLVPQRLSWRNELSVGKFAVLSGRRTAAADPADTEPHEMKAKATAHHSNAGPSTTEIVSVAVATAFALMPLVGGAMLVYKAGVLN